jgi:hypothetical protein
MLKKGLTYHLQMFWTVNLTIKHLHSNFLVIYRRLAQIELFGDGLGSPVSLQKATSFVASDGVFAFWHCDTAEVSRHLGIASI